MAKAASFRRVRGTWFVIRGTQGEKSQKCEKGEKIVVERGAYAKRARQARRARRKTEEIGFKFQASGSRSPAADRTVRDAYVISM